jgi:hypothetical protein
MFWFLVNFFAFTRKRKRANLKPYNLDGIEFLRQVVENECIGRSPDGTFKVVRKLDHVLMNLPMTAVEFLCTYSLQMFENCAVDSRSLLQPHSRPRSRQVFPFPPYIAIAS